ncbi:MAG: hypothetical protein V3T31_00685, partial [candidate division Zixibacteria bacterium]
MKLVVVFACILLALRKKVSVGLTLFGSGLLVAVLFQLSVSEVLEGYRLLVISPRFISLTSVIVLITILGSLLKDLGYLDRLTESCRGLHGGRRTAAGLLP